MYQGIYIYSAFICSLCIFVDILTVCYIRFILFNIKYDIYYKYYVKLLYIM